MYHENYPSTQSIWLRTRKATSLLLHLYLSAHIRVTAYFWDREGLNLTIWQSVTSLSQLSLRVSFATHLTLESWRRNQHNQAKQMDFFFCWTQTLINLTQLKKMLGDPSRSSSTHLHNTLHMVLDLMGWAVWRRWPGQRPLSNFLTTRRNAKFTT